MIRDTIEAHTGVAPPPEEAPPHIAAMGSVHLTSQALLMENIEALAGSRFTTDDYPRIMEEYGQRCAPAWIRAPVLLRAEHDIHCVMDTTHMYIHSKQTIGMLPAIFSATSRFRSTHWYSNAINAKNVSTLRI
jgi:hypothetical protein